MPFREQILLETVVHCQPALANSSGLRDVESRDIIWDMERGRVCCGTLGDGTVCGTDLCNGGLSAVEKSAWR